MSYKFIDDIADIEERLDQEAEAAKKELQDIDSCQTMQCRIAYHKPLSQPCFAGRLELRPHLSTMGQTFLVKSTHVWRRVLKDV